MVAPARLGASLLLAWLGIWVHELHRVPVTLGLTREGSLPFLGFAVLAYLVWYRSRRKRALLILPLGYLKPIRVLTLCGA